MPNIVPSSQSINSRIFLNITQAYIKHALKPTFINLLHNTFKRPASDLTLISEPVIQTIKNSSNKLSYRNEIELNLQESLIKNLLNIEHISNKRISREELEICNAIANKLMVSKRASILPLLPKETPALLKALDNDSYPWTKFTDILQENSGLKKNILKVANSPIFGLISEAKNLDEMIFPMDRNSLRKIVLTTAIQSVMSYDNDTYSRNYRELSFEHSLKTAIACQQLAKDGYTTQLEAFMAGLTQNIGMIIILRQMRKQQFNLNSIHSKDFIEHIYALSVQLSYQISHTWKLPPSVRIALQEQTTLSAHKRLSALGEAIFLAKRIATLNMFKPENHSLKHISSDDRLALCQRADQALQRFNDLKFSLN